MPSFNQDIREIRQTVYGRDMREPIADALEKLITTMSEEFSKPAYQGILSEYIEHTTSFDERMNDEQPWNNVIYRNEDTSKPNNYIVSFNNIEPGG